MTKPLAERLAVCSWSLRPANPQELLAQLNEIGIKRVQLALDPLRENPAVWGTLPELFAANGVKVVSGMFGTVGEDYTTMKTIERTGGVVPDATWEENWKNIQAVADLAQKMSVRLVTFHAGFLPHDASDPRMKLLLGRITQIADYYAARHIDLGFETGQESAEGLAAFLKLLNKPNVGVNFDPANIILYDNGDPIAALQLLAPWLKQCHIKDANKTKVRGEWGEEVPTGTGQVNWKAFLDTLNKVNFTGDLAIEREAGEQRVADIKTARVYLEKLS